MKDAGSSAAVKPAVEDQIASFKFVPEDIVVKAGGTVTWTNRDKAPHTAESKPDATGAFNTGNLAQGESKKIRFAEPGKVRVLLRLPPVHGRHGKRAEVAPER